MNTSLAESREHAVALRRAGKSRRQIKEMLAITSRWTLKEVLGGEPPPQWTRRPNAKDNLRAAASHSAIKAWHTTDRRKARSIQELDIAVRR